MITIDHLAKHYGRVDAVVDFTFGVTAGSVVGLVGPNGAGKSTALRCLLGLVSPTAGSATVFGRQYVELSNPGVVVGSVLDASRQHPGRTGTSVLRCAATVLGISRNRVDDVLDICGLTRAEGRRRIGTYSLGMRQRLALALALLPSPDVLVLDEPVNGLDPEGIRWIRMLLRDFAGRGGTVLVSSHLLAEMERIADEVVMVGHGRVIGTVEVSELAHKGVDLESVYLEATASSSRGGNDARAK
ncbi:ATP-binding cassette domain-containing protein [Actinomyces sp. Z3]|nr:ATP-binding cassette domain-containing protein [Actinomyces sp. Z3]